jgi:hypothetical protein
MMTYNDDEVDAFGDPFDYVSFSYDEDGNRYPLSSWYVMRDQSARTADDTVRVVIGDISDLCDALAKEVGATPREVAAAVDARQLVDEVDALPWSDDGWLDVEADEDAAEKLQDILRAAEQLPNVRVDWNGDAGSVTITRADRWQMGDDD